MKGEDRLVEHGGKLYRWFYSDGYRGLHPVIDGKTDFDTSVMEHRLVYELSRGVKLPKGVVVHHINRNRADNRPENLIALSREDHARLHRYEDCGKYNLDNPSPYRRSQDRYEDLEFMRKISNIVAVGSKLFYRSGTYGKTYYPIVNGKIDYDTPMVMDEICDGNNNVEENEKRLVEKKTRMKISDMIAREDLEELIQHMNNSEIARRYNVSSCLIGSLRSEYGLPSSNEQHGWNRGIKKAIVLQNTQPTLF